MVEKLLKIGPGGFIVLVQEGSRRGFDRIRAEMIVVVELLEGKFEELRRLVNSHSS